VYAPVYDASAARWRFWYGNDHFYMDISKTDIAARAIERGGSIIKYSNHVRLEITQTHKPGGDITNTYKFKDVLGFRPTQIPQQSDIFGRSLDQQP
jgi:hypothetical protein